MTNIDVANWGEFEARLQEVSQREVSAGHTTNFLYRGQNDSAWELTTTLERRGRQRMRVSDYHQLISRVKPQIESFTGRTWEIPDYPEVERRLRDYEGWSFPKFPDPATYSYMVHLRHHGFPSPLLDWTRSPYIAAYFAFTSASEPSCGKVSIYVYSESPRGLKGTSSYKPQIRVIGPFVRTHPRHFLQQCDYTVCAEFLKVGDCLYEWRFAGHEEITSGADGVQDVVWKLNIPWSERRKVVNMLDAYNLNSFSLFGTEESLMEMLVVREMEFAKGDD
ncbi:MAG: FRG domain-containing protein, partial [Acidobacteriia bacterium]|nr:FRG domain-containing protein [Terriglobia bacterium]